MNQTKKLTIKSRTCREIGSLPDDDEVDSWFRMIRKSLIWIDWIRKRSDDNFGDNYKCPVYQVWFPEHHEKSENGISSKENKSIIITEK